MQIKGETAAKAHTITRTRWREWHSDNDKGVECICLNANRSWRIKEARDTGILGGIIMTSSVRKGGRQESSVLSDSPQVKDVWSVLARYRDSRGDGVPGRPFSTDNQGFARRIQRFRHFKNRTPGIVGGHPGDVVDVAEDGLCPELS